MNDQSKKPVTSSKLDFKTERKTVGIEVKTKLWRYWKIFNCDFQFSIISEVRESG